VHGVVDDQVHIALGRHLLFDPPQDTQELLVPVPGFVSWVTPSNVAQAHRQQRLAAIEGLNLRFLVNAKHNCLVGRVVR
jgi:hypothetical protein